MKNFPLPTELSRFYTCNSFKHDLECSLEKGGLFRLVSCLAIYVQELEYFSVYYAIQSSFCKTENLK